MTILEAVKKAASVGVRGLDLSSRNIQSLPSEIAKLSNLETLRLAGNRLRELPPEFAKLSSLTILDLPCNSLSIPPEISEQDCKAILVYLRGEVIPEHWASELILVGEGGVGKTQLLAALRGEDFDPQSETPHGILLKDLRLLHPKEKGVEMTLSCWDFPGQQIYHATHQSFLTNRPLFVLVWSARLGFEKGNIEYWLDAIKGVAPDSPILVVATHIEDREARLPIKHFKRDYPQIEGFYQVSNKSREGLPQLVESIRNVSAGLPLMGEK